LYRKTYIILYSGYQLTKGMINTEVIQLLTESIQHWQSEWIAGVKASSHKGVSQWLVSRHYLTWCCVKASSHMLTVTHNQVTV